MPEVHVEREFTLKTAEDSLFQRGLFSFKDIKRAFSTLTFTSDGRRSIAAGGTVNLDLAGITTGKLLFVRSSAQLTIRINANDHDIEPVETGALAIHYHEGDFTSVSLINPDGTNSISEVVYVIAGI